MKQIIKYSPTLERSPTGNYWVKPTPLSFTLWLCHDGLAEYWDIKGWKQLRLGGSNQYISGCVIAEPVMGTDATETPFWYGTDRLMPGSKTVTHSRCNAYAEWLKSFNSPKVWVWVEGV